ncbi:DUF6053 domain-containing protein [Lysobacter yananisis]|uniref:DUF6053 domain-containing protein n=1 Tax=Lysobacter yananisis TaxID=1003114 RepID=UPI003CE504FD
MGGASAPTLLCQVAATLAESVGTEVPPTKAGRFGTDAAPTRAGSVGAQALLRQAQKPAPENDRPRTGRGRRSYSAEATLGCCCAGGVW